MHKNGWHKKLPDTDGHIKFILSTIQNNLALPIFKSDLSHIVTVWKLFHIYNYTISPTNNGSEAFILHIDRMREFPLPRNIFICGRGKYKILYDLWYFQDTCARYKTIGEITQTTRQKCPLLFYLTSDGNCKMYLLSKDILNIQKKSKMLHTKDVSNEKNHTIEEQYTEKSCMDKGLLSCLTPGKCFNFSDICHYKLDSSLYLVPCNTGENLYNCKHFECNTKFKCLGSYCISWNYVCDGKWDCPMGTDELKIQGCGQNRTCFNMLKCKGSQICIHLDDIYDGVSNCPNSNDEGSHCFWTIPECPQSCECLLSAVKCFNGTFNDIDKIHSQHFSFFAVHINNSDISSTFLNLDTFSGKYYGYVHVLIIIDSKIVQPCFLLKAMTNLIHVDISFNYIKRLQIKCFTKSVKVIILKNNLLTFIIDKIFSKSNLLLYLDLPNNLLQYYSEGSHFEMPVLLFLAIQNNSLHQMNAIEITTPKLLVLLPNDFIMCCFTSVVTSCISQKPWFKTCKNILISRPIQIASYCISFLILFFNVISIVLQFIIHKQKIEKNITFGIIIRSVNFSDLSYSIPLCILWIADSYYGVSYVLNDFH